MPIVQDLLTTSYSLRSIGLRILLAGPSIRIKGSINLSRTLLLLDVRTDGRAPREASFGRLISPVGRLIVVPGGRIARQRRSAAAAAAGVAATACRDC